MPDTIACPRQHMDSQGHYRNRAVIPVPEVEGILPYRDLRYRWCKLFGVYSSHPASTSKLIDLSTYSPQKPTLQIASQPNHNNEVRFRPCSMCRLTRRPWRRLPRRRKFSRHVRRQTSQDSTCTCSYSCSCTLSSSACLHGTRSRTGVQSTHTYT